MIIASVLLVLVAAGLLVVGLLQRSDPLYYSSIVASAVAALALVVGVRRLSSARNPDDDFDVRPTRGEPIHPATRAESVRPVGRAGVPVQAMVKDEPPDEPAVQMCTDADAARVAAMSIEVVVVDGRPRYHLAGCLHLLGRGAQRLPVCEAVDLGFTPCAECEPATVLLAGAAAT